MANKMVVNVLSIKRYSFSDEKTGELREGATVYVGQNTEDVSGNTLGWDVIKFSAPLSVWERAKALRCSFPSECNAQTSFKMGAGGKASLQVLDIEFNV